MSTGRHSPLAIEGGDPVRTTFLPYARQRISDDDVAAVSGCPALRLAHDRPARPALRGRAVGRHRCATRHRLLVRDRGAAWCDGGGRPRAGRRGDHDADDLRGDARTRCSYVGAEVRFADVDAGTPAHRAGDGGGRDDPPDAGDHGGRLRRSARRLRGPPRHRGAAPPDRPTIIADAAHSLGATRGGRTVGTLADMTVLSFHPAKIITTGEGGAVLTDGTSSRHISGVSGTMASRPNLRRGPTGRTRWWSSATTID